MSEHLAAGPETAPSAALAGRLRGLHLPEPVAWWPPAPGWWVLGGMMLALGLWALVRASRDRPVGRRATGLRNELQACHDEWESTRDTARYYRRVARALRLAAIGLGGRARVARLHGERWVDWLDGRATQPFSDEVREVLADAGYRRRPPERVATIHRELLHWVDEQASRGDPVSHDA